MAKALLRYNTKNLISERIKNQIIKKKKVKLQSRVKINREKSENKVEEEKLRN